MDSNFSFLSTLEDDIKEAAGLAETYLYSDPNACLMKMGICAECLVKKIYLEENIRYVSKEKFNLSLNALLIRGSLDKGAAEMLRDLWKKRGIAAHNLDKPIRACKALLPKLYFLTVWFHKKYRDKNYIPAGYNLPEDTEKIQNKIPAIKEKPLTQNASKAEAAPLPPKAQITAPITETDILPQKMKSGITVEKEYYENGDIKFEVAYKNGKRDGFSKVYDETGALISKISFEEDVQNGDETSFYPNGKPECITPYRFGLRDGIMREYYENGRLREEVRYVEDKKEGVAKLYYETGELKSETTYESGKISGIRIEYFKNGNKREEETFADGVLQGEARYYYENGNIEREVPHIDGKAGGKERRYYKNGKFSSVTPYKNGEKNGTENLYYESGNLKSITVYRSGKRHGTAKEYFDMPGEVIKEEIPYKNDHIAGSRKAFRKTGEVRLVADYRGGKKDGVGFIHLVGGKKLKLIYSGDTLQSGYRIDTDKSEQPMKRFEIEKYQTPDIFVREDIK